MLLARSAVRRTSIYSCLAGFVEPGETLEAAVAREVLEEVGLTVDDVRYFGSQAWPFPGQLMIGFTAESPSGELSVDPTELDDVRWLQEGDEFPPIPPHFTIARRLIDAFLASE